MRQQERIAVQHPLEIHALVNLLSQFRNLGIFRKILRGAEHAGQKERRIHRRSLAIPSAIAVGDVHPVIKPAVLLNSTVGKKVQGTAHTVSRLSVSDPTALDADADCGESKPGGGDTGDVAARTFSAPAIAGGTVEDQTGAQVGLLPKIQKGAMFDVFEESSIIWRDGSSANRSGTSGAYKKQDHQHAGNDRAKTLH